jgi:hypothetical protein
MVKIIALTRGVHAPRPYGQLGSCPILLSCRIVLELEQKYAFFKSLLLSGYDIILFASYALYMPNRDSFRGEVLHYNITAGLGRYLNGIRLLEAE